MSQLNRWLNPRSSAAQMALLFLACTVLAYAAPSAVLRWVVLEPDAVLQEAELWRPVSFLFVSSPTAFAVLFNILIIVSIGGRLEALWGRRRFWFFSVGIGAAAAVLTVLLSLLLRPLGGIPFVGDSLIPGAMWVAYGLIIGARETNFWGLPITGYTFALIGVGLTLLNGLFSSWLLVVPELLALTLTGLYVQFGFPLMLVHQLRAWLFVRGYKRRSRKLRAIDGGGQPRSGSKGSDEFLH